MHTVLFDINETVIDHGALDPLFTAWFGDPAARREWFAQTLHFAMTLAATSEYRDFSEVGAAALDAVASRHGVQLPVHSLRHLREALQAMPAHADVVLALTMLREAGFRTGALSNNSLPLLRVQLRYAEIEGLFDDVISVSEAGALKPARAVYDFAIARLHSPRSQTWVVAAHGWDIAGATRAGLRGAFVARTGQAPDPFAPPEIVGSDLVAVARTIIDTVSG
jgi:2-haloacid dehalogenase